MCLVHQNARAHDTPAVGGFGDGKKLGVKGLAGGVVADIDFGKAAGIAGNGLDVVAEIGFDGAGKIFEGRPGVVGIEPLPYRMVDGGLDFGGVFLLKSIDKSGAGPGGLDDPDRAKREQSKEKQKKAFVFFEHTPLIPGTGWPSELWMSRREQAASA